ncbi:MAG: hypothetical protein PHG05_01910 [Candidatus Nanoarchaeia archaeon]|nr:hypothetical protein [Candidatus Nanoarchaeia archaeon]
MKKTNEQKGTFTVIAALIVLYSAMWNPWVSVGVSIVALTTLAIWEFNKK